MKLKMLLHEQGLFFIETSCNSANMAEKLAYVPLFWMDNADKLLSLSDITRCHSEMNRQAYWSKNSIKEDINFRS